MSNHNNIKELSSHERETLLSQLESRVVSIKRSILICDLDDDEVDSLEFELTEAQTTIKEIKSITITPTQSC